MAGDRRGHSPAQRARELREAWETFVGGPEQFSGVSVRKPIEATARWEIHPLSLMAPMIRACLGASADESRHLIVVSDANGVLLWVEGSPSVRMQAADSMNFAEGTLWSEVGAGTNAIGTALAAEHAVQVFASERFNELVQAWTCAAAPVTDPDSGQVGEEQVRELGHGQHVDEIEEQLDRGRLLGLAVARSQVRVGHRPRGRLRPRRPHRTGQLSHRRCPWPGAPRARIDSSQGAAHPRRAPAGSRVTW